MRGLAGFVAACCLVLGSGAVASAAERTLTYFPAGPIYAYRWKVLELALEHTRRSEGLDFVLKPYQNPVTQNRGIHLLQAGTIDVIALGTNRDRESQMLPIRIDISRGVIGYRVFLISASDQARIAGMDDEAFRTRLTFGLSSQWADVPVMRENGYTVVTANEYDRLFDMLAAHRFDAMPRGISEAPIELKARQPEFPQLAIENTRALYFPYPIYFWVNRHDTQLAGAIERGLRAALADGSFRKLFETYHAPMIEAMHHTTRRVIRLKNPLLPPGTPDVDTRWWWH
jgi:ABC-type amino acid transport substrate-binding protein